MLFFKRRKKPPPNDGRIEKKESVDIKKEVAEYVSDTISSLEKRYHQQPIPFERRQA